MRAAALCAGYGGLELGLQLAGVDHELVWYAEIDPHASLVMAHHHPNVPNLGDLTTITDPPPVDIVTAGFPCQPVSTAGARKGVNDERWLIHDVVGLARRAGARWLLLENVSGLFSANDGEALGQVADALAEGGFDAEWAPLRASDVGACHRRERWFCLAQNADSEPRNERRFAASRQTQGGRPRPDTGRRSGAPAVELLPTPAASNPNDGETVESWEARRQRNKAKGYNGNGQGTPLGIAVQLLPTPTVQDSANNGGPSQLERNTVPLNATVDWGQYGPAIKRHRQCVTRRPAPSPTNEQGRLSAQFVEWMMGLPEGHVTDVPGLSRAQQLGRLGNGVVPQQAAEAIRQLAARFGWAA